MTNNKPEIKHPQAPPFNKRHMVIARRTTEELYVHLSQQEALERGQEAAEKLNQARALADALAAHAKQVKADIKALENRAQHLQEQCRIEAELAPVECDVVFDYVSNEAYTVRCDTNQEIRNSRRTLQPSEIQHFQTNMDTHLQSVPLSKEEPAEVVPFVPIPTPEEPEARAALHSELWGSGVSESLDDADKQTDDVVPLRVAIHHILSREGSNGITNRKIVSELLQGGIYGDDALALTEAVDDELDALKRNGIAQGRRGPGKRWRIIGKDE